jgi:predicted phage terminase large subunit-like protein
MSSAVKGLRIAAPSAKRSSRVEQCRGHIKKFVQTYLKHHFTSGFCELHEEIFRRIDAEAPKEGKRDALIAPRKFGKSTIYSLALPLYHLAYQTKYFVLMIGESSGGAEGNLATLTQELETNDQLLDDFPHLAPARDPKNQLVKWTDRQLVMANYATVIAKGMGSRMRGIKYRQRRPDLAIIDDPESPETGDTFLKRQRHKRWFGGTFMGLGGDAWDIFVIGNLPNHDCLIADLVKDKNWHGKLYRAVNLPHREEERYPIGNTKTDGSPLWPEKWPIEALEAYKNEPNVGTLGYAREMLNDPREEEDKAFKPPEFEYFDYTEERRKSYSLIATAVDPAGGEKEGDYRRGVRDWCAIVTAGRTKDGFIEVFDVRMIKKTPDLQIDEILAVYSALRPRMIGVEEVMYKNLYATSMVAAARKKRLYPSVRTFPQPKKNKIARILGIQPMIHDFKVIRFARHLYKTVPVYFAQFDEFPMGHDDGPDATEMVVRQLENKNPNARPVGVGGSSYWKRSA